jgi:hypothetical protein
MQTNLSFTTSLDVAASLGIQLQTPFTLPTLLEIRSLIRGSPGGVADLYDCSTRRLSGACEGQLVGGEGGGVGVGVGLGEAEHLGTLLWSNKM